MPVGPCLSAFSIVFKQISAQSATLSTLLHNLLSVLRPPLPSNIVALHYHQLYDFMLRSKQIFIILLKYGPSLGVLAYMVHYTLLPFGVRSPLSDYIVDMSAGASLLWIAASCLFGFCRIHRACIVYIAVASVDVDLHHWLHLPGICPELIPDLMVTAGAVLLCLSLIKLHNDPHPVRRPAARSGQPY